MLEQTIESFSLADSSSFYNIVYFPSSIDIQDDIFATPLRVTTGTVEFRDVVFHYGISDKNSAIAEEDKNDIKKEEKTKKKDKKMKRNENKNSDEEGNQNGSSQIHGPVLNGISFTVRGGQTLAIVGGVSNNNI